MTTGTTTTLRRRSRIGVPALVFFTVAASAPLATLGGGIPTTFAVSGVPGVGVSFLLVGAVLALFAVGYAAMSRHVVNAGAFYAYLARGVGPTSAGAGALVALVSYNAIQIGLYGLFGAGFADFAATVLGLDLAWWVWALLALAVVAVLGVLRIDLNAAVLAVILGLECLVVVLYDVAAFARPAAGAVTTAGLDPAQLFVPGVGAVFALSVAAYIGFESAASYSEECRDPRRTVGRATYVAVAFISLFYALTAWAMTVTVGPADVQAAATEQGAGLVFGLLTQQYGDVVANTASFLYTSSLFAGMLAIHNGVARYLFALGRERVLPGGLGRVGARSRAPVGGSLAQTGLALVVVVVFAIAGADPILQLFTWLAAVAAVGVLVLMTGTSVAVIGFFAHERHGTTVWQRLVAPGLAAVLLAVLVTLLVVNFDVLLGTPDSPLRWILPALVLIAAVAGAVWARVLRAHDPGVYAGIGQSRTEIEEPSPARTAGSRAG